MATLHAGGTAIRAEAWTSHNGGRYPKQVFTIGRAQHPVTCPAQQVIPIRPGAQTIRLHGRVCGACDRRAACTVGPGGHGRSTALHPHESLLQSLPAAMRTSEGRAVLRQGTSIEHSLARLDRIQGSKARHNGVRKNTLDVRRCAVVANLERVWR